MHFTVRKYKNPQNKEDSEKYYPVPFYIGTKDLSDLASEIAHSTSLTKSDVGAVIEELLVVFNNHLLNGEKIKIKGLGIFRTSFSGKGCETEDEVNANSIDASSVKVTFVSDNSIRKALKTDISFTKVKR